MNELYSSINLKKEQLVDVFAYLCMEYPYLYRFNSKISFIGISIISFKQWKPHQNLMMFIIFILACKFFYRILNVKSDSHSSKNVWLKEISNIFVGIVFSTPWQTFKKMFFLFRSWTVAFTCISYDNQMTNCFSRNISPALFRPQCLDNII